MQKPVCYAPAIGGGALSDTAIRPSVCPMAQLPYTIGSLAACSLAVCGLRTHLRMDVDPPLVDLLEAYRLAAPG